MRSPHASFTHLGSILFRQASPDRCDTDVCANEGSGVTGLVTRVQTDRCVYRSGPSKTWLKSKTRRAQPSGASARRTGDKEPPSRHLGYPVGPLRTAVRWPGTVLLTLPPHPRIGVKMFVSFFDSTFGAVVHRCCGRARRGIDASVPESVVG
jgi:hypothetical protein